MVAGSKSLKITVSLNSSGEISEGSEGEDDEVLGLEVDGRLSEEVEVDEWISFFEILNAIESQS